MTTTDNSDRKLEIAPVTWHVLRPHLERDAIILVKAENDLRTVANEIAADNTSVVSAWIEDGSLSKPSDDQVDLWNSDPTLEFQCAIVQPFVLVQLPSE